MSRAPAIVQTRVTHHRAGGQDHLILEQRLVRGAYRGRWEVKASISATMEEQEERAVAALEFFDACYRDLKQSEDDGIIRKP